MRLIDVDDFMEYLGFDNTDEEREENIGQIVTLEDFDRQETAYDTDKVIEWLEERRKYLMKDFVLADKAAEVKERTMARINEIDGLIEIVKPGGVAND